MDLATSEKVYPVVPLPVGQLVRRGRIEHKIRLFPFLTGLTGPTGKQANH